MKRSSNSCTSSTAKKVKFTEETKMDSSFSPDNAPENFYHLGGNKYVTVSDFADVVRIHVRLYKPDVSGRLQPTKNGITFSPSVWQGFASEMDFLDQLESGNLQIIEGCIMLSDELINDVKHFSLQRFYKKSDFSRKFVPGFCLLSETEWKELKRIHQEVSATVTTVMFGRVFQRLLLQEVQSRTPTVPVEGNNETEEMILTTSMTELLKDILQKNIAEIFKCNECEMGYENQLGHECLSSSNSYLANIYGDRAILRTDLNDFLRDFVERNIQLSYSITENFVNSSNMSCLIKSAFDLYISSDPDPWRLL